MTDMPEGRPHENGLPDGHDDNTDNYDHTIPQEDLDEFADPFDPERFRDTPGIIPTDQELTSVPVRPPSSDEFFRVHPDEDYTLEPATMVWIKDLSREPYIVLPAFSEALGPVGRRVRLITCITRHDVTLLWPLKLADEGSGGKRWMDTALKAAKAAETRWVRMYSNQRLGGWDFVAARGELHEPKWRDVPFRHLLRLGFEGHIVDCYDHAVIRHLNGDL